MTGKRITARRREHVAHLTDRQRSAFLPVPYWMDETGPGYDPDRARDDALDEAAVDAIAGGRANEADGWHVAPFDDLPF